MENSGKSWKSSGISCKQESGSPGRLSRFIFMQSVMLFSHACNFPLFLVLVKDPLIILFNAVVTHDMTKVL